MKVHKLMTKEVATITPEANLKEAARIMIDRKISGLPVVDPGGGLAGMVTEGDVLHQESIRSPATSLASLFRNSGEIPTTVAEAMTKKVVSINVEADHTEAARLMESAGVKRLPVLNDDKVLLGIISRSDIVRAFGRSDTAIENEIATEVVERILWLDSSEISVKVANGQVQLEGSVPTKSDARILEEMSKRIDGVVAVDANGLRFDVDDTKQADTPMSGHGRISNW